MKTDPGGGRGWKGGLIRYSTSSKYIAITSLYVVIFIHISKNVFGQEGINKCK
jgi:hypothetical protein